MQKILYLEFFHGCKNGKYLGAIIDNSVITYDEIIDAIKSISKNMFKQKLIKQQVIQKISIFYFPFYYLS